MMIENEPSCHLRRSIWWWIFHKLKIRLANLLDDKREWASLSRDIWRPMSPRRRTEPRFCPSCSCSIRLIWTREASKWSRRLSSRDDCQSIRCGRARERWPNMCHDNWARSNRTDPRRLEAHCLDCRRARTCRPDCACKERAVSCCSCSSRIDLEWTIESSPTWLIANKCNHEPVVLFDIFGIAFLFNHLSSSFFFCLFLILIF